MAKIVRVNMTDRSIKFEDVPEKYRFLGGRALTSSIVVDEVDPACHPLGPNNKLVVAPGMIAGTAAPSSGRLSVGGKSPLTGTIKEANAGGIPGQLLGRLGIKAIIVEGQPRDKEFYLLKIDSTGAQLVSASEISGKGMYETNALLWKKYGSGAGIIGIGPAGEMKLLNAGVSCNDSENSPGRYAGRGGLGAVMGSKGLKAIVVSAEKGLQVPLADKELFDRGRKKMVDALLKHPVTSQTLPTYGTAALVNVLNEAGGLPTRNFSAGRFEGAAKTGGEAMAEINPQRGGTMSHPCHPGCVIRCSNIYHRPDGSHHVSPIEYESTWALGANCGIDNLDDIAELNRICNDVGLDTIETGCTLAVAMEAGLARFGDGKKAIELLSEVGKGSALGRILGNGTEYTARAFGVTRCPTVKGQSMPAYEPRVIKGIGVTYATTPMGADHTAGYTIATEVLKVGGEADPSDVNKADLARAFQAVTMFVDSTGYCLFVTFATSDYPEALEGMVETINGTLGTNWSTADVLRLGKEWLKKERKFNEAAGFTNKDDRLPEFMKYEKLPPHDAVWNVSDEILDAVHNY
ncbi:MAG: aldehyde ferredoxin oxidoreductase C-terminal domain-containing protein [Peptococcaceae bacterium]|nr:aldehyde ferredoxin oxidoreductase [Peptococcaceae bacterium]MDH7523871.1 aldehyde ferredoxin oxidoreductase C-terminal domain-containing protein [Peptococcaceae bacterium]